MEAGASQVIVLALQAGKLELDLQNTFWFCILCFALFFVCLFACLLLSHVQVWWHTSLISAIRRQR